ncbi:hypothetical protein, partial [Pseudomonas amygdali]|uniref:hypothetical protein n=1 Tax=Pseudomonas amygdali TaxID=47877 RepID=UPI001C5579B9
HIGSSKPPVLPRGVNSRLALGGHFYSGGDNWQGGLLPNLVGSSVIMNKAKNVAAIAHLNLMKGSDGNWRLLDRKWMN